jgi:hypothetical protein
MAKLACWGQTRCNVAMLQCCNVAMLQCCNVCQNTKAATYGSIQLVDHEVPFQPRYARGSQTLLVRNAHTPVTPLWLAAVPENVKDDSFERFVHVVRGRDSMSGNVRNYGFSKQNMICKPAILPSRQTQPSIIYWIRGGNTQESLLLVLLHSNKRKAGEVHSSKGRWQTGERGTREDAPARICCTWP